jgi:hypothetical protein
MKALFILSLFPFFGYAQTTVIAKKTKKAIYVAADSRVTFMAVASDGQPIRDTIQFCKIHTYGKFNFALLGLDIFNAREQAKKSCEGAKSFDDLAQKYATTWTKHLGTVLKEQRDKDNAGFLDLLKYNAPYCSQLMIFGKEADSLYLAVIVFKIENAVLGDVIVSATLIKRDLLYGGHVEEIRDTIEKKQTWKHGTIKTMNALIKIEANAWPLWVGAPIDMIKVTKKKIKWIQKKKTCA